ncbi:ribonuclease P [Mucor mucedo]|uniref:ribonuclease P n=1 Tax=Mucor mucedo TaxID=29922 RepID=UPI00221EC8D3|nr:ribonuclease P [Mucor mucedo]KAI7892008.1 ribonuclease P [Mucor mucedo]
MHSLDANLNSDNVVVLNPNGKLYLSLLKNTYETFGMEGIKRTKADIKHDKHIIMIDLKSPHFKPDSKAFNRLKWCLENTLTTTFSMVACATDKVTGTTIDIQWPSMTQRIMKLDMEPELETLTDIHIPTFDSIKHDIHAQPTEDWDTEAMDAIEWLGLAHVKASRIKNSDRPNPFISVYQAPGTLLESQRGTLVKWKGFIPASIIQNILTNLRKMMASGVTSEWTSLSVWGYKDSPFTWKEVQHYHALNGENDYTFLLLPKLQSAYTYQLYGSHHVK